MNLKRLLLITVSITYCTINGYAQDANTRKNCFDDYNFMFKSRGTNPVPDGMQKVSVAVVEANGKANCIVGQILVKNGNIVLPLYIPREDGSMTETRGTLDNNFYRETVGQIPYKIEEAMSPVYILEGKRKAPDLALSDLLGEGDPTRLSLGPLKSAYLCPVKIDGMAFAFYPAVASNGT